MKDNLPNDLDELKAIIRTLLGKIEKLESENAELRRRLGLNSENSHKPPSSDGLKKKPALPRGKNKKNGGQEGHAGKTLKQVENPDSIVIHNPMVCSCCGRVFHEAEIETVKVRQVFDLPPPKLIVTEHRVGRAWCCGRTQEGEFPINVTQAVQYGSRVYTLCTLLSVHYQMPQEKVSQLFDDVYGQAVNSATLINTLGRAYTLLEPEEEKNKRGLLAEAVAHFDESSVRVAGKNYWMHVACSPRYTYLFAHASRGLKAMSSAQSVLKDFTGHAVHDCLPSYFSFEQCRHVICNAHILRELANLIECGSSWAKNMNHFLMGCYQLEKPPNSIGQTYDDILLLAEQEEPPPAYKKRGRPKQSVGRCLLNRLRKYKEGVLSFAFDKTIPFTNNQAERDIRCVKTKLKVSGGFRSISGLNAYARIQSVISTWRKQKLDVFDQLNRVFYNQSISGG